MLLHDSDKGMGVGSLLIMDVDADGHQEVVAGSTDGYLYILSTRAATTRRNPLRTHGRTVSGHNRIMNAADL
jgi:glutamate synthase domain-containing protein 1